MDEVENHAGEDIGAEPTSFEEILSIVGPDSVSTVTTALTKRGFSKTILNAYATKVQNDEGLEFTFANLKKYAQSILEQEQINTVMVVPQPLKVEISGWDFEDETASDISIPNSPFDPSRGSHTVRIESSVYIDRSDFRTEDSDDYFGLAPGKIVGLKYAFRVRCESVETNGAGEVVLVRVEALPDSELPEDKPKGSIQWVPASTAVPVELHAFAPIDSVETPSDLGWDAELNAESEVELSDTLADPSLLSWNPEADQLFRFDRVGYFVVSKDTSFAGSIILTQTLLFDNYRVESDDMSVKQRTAKARQTAQVEKRKKLTSYLAPPVVPGSPGADTSSIKSSTGSGKVTMAERADIARHTAELETQAKIERMKLAKQEEFSQSTAGGNYRESARLEQEQLAQLKLDRMKQEKLAEIVPRKTTGVSFEDDGEDGPRLTPLQRKEEMKRRAEQEKQERLADFLRKKSGTNENEGETGAIKDRFEQAKRLQQQTEEERLEKIRLSRGATPSLKNVAIKDVWSDALNTTNNKLSPHPVHATGSAPSGGAERAKSKWEQALNESKQSEEQRVNHTKRQTIAQFRLTDGTGLVKKRIGEWEELFVELAATVEELEQTLAAARELSEQNELAHDLGELHRLQKEFRDAAETPEDFELGSTRIFNIKLLDFHVAAYIKRTLQDVKTKHFALQCGVYGDQEGGKPPIDLFAAAIKADEKTMYIALTIKASPGFELDARAYGVKKVAIFSKDVNQKMLERLVNIVPQKGWEGWVANGSYDNAGSVDQSFVSAVDESGERPEGESAHIVEAQYQQQYGMSVGSDGPQYLTTEELADLQNRGNFSADGTPIRSETGQKTRLSGAGEDEDVEGESGNGDDQDEEDRDGEQDPNGSTPLRRSGKKTRSSTGASGEGGMELDQSRSSDFSEQDDVHNVFTDIMGEDSILEGDNESNSDPDADTPQKGYGSHDAAHARPSKAEIKSMLNRTFSASEVDEDEGSDEDEVSDVGDDTWKNAVTPKKNRKTNGEEEIVRNASMDYKFENANDAALRFIKGEPVHDADGDEEVEYDADEDVNASTFNALKPSTVARVCLPRAFLPEHVTLEMLNNPNSKYSWSHDDEREEGLPAANHFSFNVNLQDIQNHHCSRNMLVLEGAEQCMVFTGTLKCGTSASKYILNGNKIFEWVRGAACSGWLLKWPMQSQKFGRRMRRFFVLRDHILSYHVTRPADEEEVYSNYSLSSLHITDNTTVEVGRHMFLRSLVITTPLDKLWIRMQTGNTDEATWIANINKSIQQLQRKKLFMSKVRIESKWYHESSNFHLVAVDALSLADQYIKVALFTLETPSPASESGSMFIPPMQQYSIDIGTNIADGSALGIDGAPSTHSAKLVRPNESADLRTSLKCLKIYGDIILLGGSNGFLGVGAMGFTSSVDADGSPMQVMFCVPYGNNQHDPSGPNSPMRGSGDGEPSFQYPSDPSESWRSPQQKYARSGSFMVHPSGPGFPHRRSSTIVSIAAAQEAHRFVAADDEGTLSLWYFHKHNAISENLENLKTPRKMAHNSRRSLATPGSAPKRRGSEKLQVRKPILKGVLKLASTDPQGIYAGEKVIKMNFLMDESQLIVSTNKRLILLILGKRADATSPKAKAATPSAFNTPATPASNASNVHSDGMHTPPPIHTHDEELELGFIGWVELDRAIPGKVGLFAMHMSVNYVPAYSGAMSATIQRTITQWRITEEDQAVASRFQLSTKKKSPEGKNKCTVYRFEWTETMFSAALDQIKYF